MLLVAAAILVDPSLDPYCPAPWRSGKASRRAPKPADQETSANASGVQAAVTCAVHMGWIQRLRALGKLKTKVAEAGLIF